MTNEKSSETLNEFLRGEISAVETYRQALEKMVGSPHRTSLEECRRSHEERVAKLKAEIALAGAQPSQGSGPWGAFARLVEGGAKVFGESAAVAALEEGEDHGLKQYRGDLNKLDPAVRQLVESDLLPAQERTHRTMSTLKKAMA
jgi:demethoxyubiquinone hydroxylase (CLK1/Coq7/Cat5 family)